MLVWFCLVFPVLSSPSFEALARGQSRPLPEQLIKVYTNHLPYWSSHSGPLTTRPNCPRAKYQTQPPCPSAPEIIQMSQSTGMLQNLANPTSLVIGEHPSTAAVCCYPFVFPCGTSPAAFSFEFCISPIQGSVCCVSPSEESLSLTKQLAQWGGWHDHNCWLVNSFLGVCSWFTNGFQSNPRAAVTGTWASLWPWCLHLCLPVVAATSLCGNSQHKQY